MKLALGALTGKGGSETSPYGSMTSCVETLGLAREGAKSDAASRRLAEVWRACGAFEWVTIVYLGWMVVVLSLFHRNIPHAGIYLAIHVAIAAGIIALAWIDARSENRALQFARHWYPLAIYIFFFEELQDRAGDLFLVHGHDFVDVLFDERKRESTC